MQPQQRSQTGPGATTPIVLNVYGNPFSVGMGVIVSGTVNYTVQHTFDDISVQGWNPATANWLNHIFLLNLTANMDSNYAFPVRAIRLLVNSGSGTATLYAIQSGGIGGS